MAVSATVANDVAESVFKNFIKKSKIKIFSLDEITAYLKERLGEDYTSELGIAVRHALVEHPKMEFFREGEYIHEQKYHWCVGNWLAVRDAFKNPIEGKASRKMESWQKSEDDDGAWLD